MHDLPTILVVDDEQPICRAIARLVRGSFRVITAGDFDQAMAQAESGSPVVAIVDYNLPGRKGDEVLRELRARYPGVHRIMLTGAPPDNVSELLQSGVVQRLFIKPWVAEEVLEHLAPFGRGG
jgi:DNA-binding response OmpR family regulator